MRLTSVQISHYKSLSEVNLDNLPPLTLLVGANGTGKSNFVDALRFLRDMVVEGLDHAMSKRGGILMVREHALKKPYDISIKITFTQKVFGENKEGFYEIFISNLKAGNYQIKREHAKWFSLEIDFEEAKDGRVILANKERFFHRSENGQFHSNGLFTKVEGVLLLPDQSAFIWDGQNIRDFLSELRFSSIFPNTLREPSRPDLDNILKESGANWASVIKALKKTDEGKQALQHILEMMQVVMPTLQDISVLSVGSYLVPQFHVKDNETVHAFDPVQLSDGTLRIFGILLALYQTPPPPFIALEEPEQTIHPAILVMLAEAFREVSERTQLLITSHSPYLVDQFQPEEIRIVSMQDGKTRVSPIKAAQVKSVKENLISLQELMVAEGLLP